MSFLGLIRPSNATPALNTDINQKLTTKTQGLTSSKLKASWEPFEDGMKGRLSGFGLVSPADPFLDRCWELATVTEEGDVLGGRSLTGNPLAGSFESFIFFNLSDGLVIVKGFR